MGKKIFLLLVLLVVLIIFTVSSFDYKTILNKYVSNEDDSNSNKTEIVGSIVEKVNEIKEKVIGNTENDEALTKDSIVLELEKVDGNVVMNGILRNEEQAKEIADTLNINREGDYKFNPSVELDGDLLSKLAKLVTPFKDFLSDGSKLVLNGDKVSLTGELKDSSYKELFKSIINRVGLDIDSNISGLSHKTTTEEIIDTIKEKNITNLKDVASNEEVKKITEKAKELKEAENLKLVQSNINKILKENKITFERRSTKITNDSYASVKKVAQILKDNANIKIEIGGHTDSRGAASLNKRISQDRANSVMNALIDLGIEKSRLKAVGYGEDFPIAKDDADGLSEINRRVEIKILGE